MTSTNRSKLLGDAGEHYALSQFSFAGTYAAKMPDNWAAYDLAVETGSGLVRVSVKTRSETTGWKTSKWFQWDERKKCEWLVLIFKPNVGQVRSWVLPTAIAEQYASKPKEQSERSWARELSWKKLNEKDLIRYEDNWTMSFLD